jgi:hypothetical protein
MAATTRPGTLSWPCLRAGGPTSRRRSPCAADQSCATSCGHRGADAARPSSTSADNRYSDRLSTALEDVAKTTARSIACRLIG